MPYLTVNGSKVATFVCDVQPAAETWAIRHLILQTFGLHGSAILVALHVSALKLGALGVCMVDVVEHATCISPYLICGLNS